MQIDQQTGSAGVCFEIVVSKIAMRLCGRFVAAVQFDVRLDVARVNIGADTIDACINVSLWNCIGVVIEGTKFARVRAGHRG